MKDLENGLNSVHLSQKTGLVYHLDTNHHKYNTDPRKVPSGHVENPMRLISILEHLQKLKLTDQCAVVNEFSEISEEKITETHGKEYLDYFLSLWPEGHTKKKVNFVDTYFTKDSVRAARLAAEATVFAAGKVFKGDWANAFALVRPPGHHACAKDNRIGGFCFLNNVVMACHQLKKQGAKRIAILDWDVHHGDSSQKLTFADPSILYLSLHKFNKGAFYPGESGDVKNVGEGPGEGFNLNFPINQAQGQFVGDQEYIFAYERMVLPVLKEFKPEIVLVSCGFDCLLFDPLGGFQVTQDALSYMLYSISNQVTQKVVVALEGGYNLRQLPIASECLLRVLLGEFYPNSANNFISSPEVMKAEARPLSLFLRDVEDNLKVWTKYWPCLSSEDLVNFHEKVSRRVENTANQISGHEKAFEWREDCVKKRVSEKEFSFYAEEAPKFKEISHLFPRILSLEESKGSKFIVMENFNPLNDFSIIDIKLSNSIKDKLGGDEIFSRFHFYISGYRIVNEKKEILESRRHFFCRVNIEQSVDLLRRFFSSGSSSEVLASKVFLLTREIGQLCEFFEKEGAISPQSSIIVLHHPKSGELKIKFVDFSKFKRIRDSNFITSLKGILEFFRLFLTQLEDKTAERSQ